MENRILTVVFAGLAVILSGWVGTSAWQDQDTSQSEQIKSAARKEFMRGKLVSNQQIVEGLSLKDFGLIQQGARGVTELVKGQHWFVLKTPEYKAFSQEMESSAQRLISAAEDKNIEAAALRYFELTLKCIDCHMYLETVGH